MNGKVGATGPAQENQPEIRNQFKNKRGINLRTRGEKSELKAGKT